MTEKLTYEERAALADAQDQNLDEPWFGAKALRIIDSHITLTPEHEERIRRIATATGRKPEQVLHDAVTLYLVRMAGKGGLGPGQW